MGRVAAPFGVQGWIKVQPFTKEVGGLKPFAVWWLGSGDNWREYPVAEAGVHGQTLIAKLAGCDDRDAAAALKGCEIAVPREQLPAAESDEYYWADLIGLAVVNTQGEALGTVSELLATGANDVLVVQGERERLIPFIAQVVLEVDLAARLIRVDWGADY
jgi:16S rRNA processing protein RimM